MTFRNMREYTHEEFVQLVKGLNEEELLELSKTMADIRFYSEWH